MISLDVTDLWKEIQDAETLRRKFNEIHRQIIEKLVGIWYRADLEEGEPVPENYFYEYLAFVMPQLIFERPQVKIKPTKLITDAETANTMEVALNHWCKIEDVKSIIEHAVRDMCIGYAITKVGLDIVGDHPQAEGQPFSAGNELATPTKPFVIHVPSSDFFIDAYAAEFSKARLMGHRFERDLEDIKVDERYDQEAAGTLRENEPSKPDDSPFQLPTARSSRRKVVTLYEVYLPEHRKIITMAAGESGGPIQLQSETYYGPDFGPYQMWGAYDVPNQIYPLSPLMAVYEQFLEVQDHAVAAADEAKSYKVIGAVDGNDEAGAAAAKAAKNGDFVSLKSTSTYQKMEVGGTTQGRLDYLEYIRSRLDRSMGFSDAQRGVTQETTATEASIADNNSDLRIDYLRQRVRDCCIKMFRAAGWYFFYEETVVMSVSQVDENTGIPSQGFFLGGNHWPGQEDQNYVDLAFDIDPMSMVRTDNALVTKRAQDAVQLVVGLAPAIPQMPWINWTKLLDMWGDAMNLTEFSKTVINLNVLASMNPMLAMAYGQTQQQDSGAGPGAMAMLNPQFQGQMGGGMSQSPALGQGVPGNPPMMGGPFQPPMGQAQLAGGGAPAGAQMPRPRLGGVGMPGLMSNAAGPGMNTSAA